MYTQEEITKAFGPYNPPAVKDEEFIQQSIQEIQLFPSVLEAFIEKLKPEHYSETYREAGWNFRQIFHHLADSHMQAFSRFKLVLTEDKPIIKPYIQDLWAETSDSLTSDPILSVQLLKPLHMRWVILLKNMEPDDFERIFVHPEYQKEYTLATALGLYAWHGKHHYTQMYRKASNNGWM